MTTTDLERVRTALVGRFTVERELGQGGMALVYLARDVRHDRLVAVKVLRPDIAAALGATRFLREIQIAARLAHPHIVPLYDSGDAGGLLYYVMPFVEGESLRSRISRDQRLSVEDAMRISGEVADALCYAHGQGVVHRDIKPENILLQAGRAVVTDFGIARAVDAASNTGPGLTTLTATGVVLGTPLYMSPEQVVGEQIDGRTDIYALGCVMFEMLTGKPPYSGSSAQAVLARHTIDPIPSVRKSRPDVPVAIERTIAKALAKAPADRFASAADLRDTLTGAAPAPPRTEGWRPTRGFAITVAATLVLAVALWTVFHRSAAAADRSVAVLPFENLGNGADDQYFADGITAELINALGRVPGLRVPGRTSAFALRRENLDSKTIGSRLNATMLLEGSAQRAGDKLRVTAELIDAVTGDVLWSDVYRRDVKDILDVEDEISRAIVAALQVHLAGGARRLVEHGTENSEAHDLYLKGLYFLNHRAGGPAALQRSIAFLKQALALDSNYAQAWAGLGQAYGFLAGFDVVPPSDAFERAKAAASRAVALDSELALAHTSLGFIAIFHDWDWPAAKRELDRASAIDSTEPSTHLYRAWYELSRGRVDDALAQMEAARRLDPLHQIYNARYGTLLNYAHRNADAEAALHRALDLDTANAEAKGDLAMTLILQRRYVEALPYLSTDTTDQRPFPQVAYRGYLYHMANLETEAQALEHRLARHARERYITPEVPAYLAMGRRDTAAALDWLEQGYRERSFFLWTVAVDPVFEPLHGSPRFERIVQQMGLVEPAPRAAR